MAGSNKRNTLKELFIKIGLAGAKEATKDLDKLDKKTEDYTKDAKKAAKQTDTFGDQLVKLGIISKQTLTGMREFRKLSPMFKAINLSVKTLTASLRMVRSVVRGVGSRLSNIFQIASGISLANIFDSLATKVRSLGTRALDLAVEEESVRAGLRTTFGLQGNAAFAGRFLKSLEKIAKKFGTGSTELAKAFQGTSIPLKKLTRAAEIVAKFGILRPDVNPATVARQISIMMNTGNVEETLKNLAPFLLKMSPEERMVRGFESIEKHLSKISMDSNKTFAFRSKLLDAKFDELLRTFGRPVRDALNWIMGEMLRREGKDPTLINMGTALARVIATFADSFFLGKSNSSLISKLDKVLGDMIKIGGVIAKDFVDFMIGAESGLRQIFLPDMAPDKANLLSLILSMVGEAVNFFVDKLLKALISPESKQMVREIGKSFASGVSDVEEGAVGAANWAIGVANGFMEWYQGLDDSINETIKDTTGVTPPGASDRVKEKDSKAKDPKGASVNFNTDIKIATSQPASVVRNQLANQLALIGNQGRLS